MANRFLDELFGLSGQVAVVIGGTGVLGGALCRGLAGRGHGGRGRPQSPSAGTRCVAAIRERRRHRPFSAGRSQRAARLGASVAATSTVAQYGRVDMLINGAGVNSASTYLEVRDEDWDLRAGQQPDGASISGCQIFGRHMIAAGRAGAILNIASVTADRPLSRVFAYSASKAAVVNLTRNVAREFAPTACA